MKQKTVELFTYDDFRNFLKDFFQNKKKMKRTFSQRFFSQKAGFADHSQLTHLMSGRRSVTDLALDKLIKGLELEGSEKEYFTSLVKYNQSKTSEEKENWYHRLNAIRQKSDFYKVNLKQFKYFEEWYYPVVLEIAILDTWDNDYKKLSRLLRPSISAKQAREAVKLLLQIGMLEEKDGKFTKPNNIMIPGGIPVYALKKARHELIKMGIEASDNISPKERYFLNYGFVIAPGNLEKYNKLLDEFEDKLETLVINENEDPEYMYQCNVQFYPVTNKLTKIEDGAEI